MSEAYVTSLIELSKIDAGIFRLIAERKKVEDKYKTQEKNLLKIQNDFKLKTDSLQTKKNKLETEEQRLKLEKQKLADRRKAIGTLGSPKLQEKANKEISFSAKAISSQEDILLSLISEIETGEKALLVDQEKVEVEIASIASARNELELTLINLEEREVTYRQKQSELYKEIPADVLDVYKKLLDRYPMDAVSALSGTTCGGCFLDVGRQIAQQIAASAGVVKCRGCSRILYIPAE